MKILTQNRERILSINNNTNVSIGLERIEDMDTIYWNIFLNFNAFYVLGCYKGEGRSKQILRDIFKAIKSKKETFEMPIE